ncbi:MAG TPA: complex I NDUFA9 subunit family protein [Burkholderiaceae bacterium]|nr:complex I NDUFA9 subunit family protein [Burkholderiaceae bacterium]
MIKKKICILGGTGFVGRRIAAQLSEAGHNVLITTRHYARARDLTVVPTVQLLEGDVHTPAFLRRAFSGVDAVINLIGILNEKGRSGRGFAAAHAELPAKVVDACHQAGVKRLLHMSALNAAADAPSHYLRTKAAGEETVHRAASADFHVTSFRPSVIFGPRDSFTNRFADLLKIAPVFPLACPHARFQPVYVEDVARAYVESLDQHQSFGQRYSLCGPKVYTLREIVAYLAQLLGKRVHIIGLNDALSHLQAAVFEFFPGKPFSLDNYRSLQVDSVCKEGFPKIFGITPAALETIAPTYLGAGAHTRLSTLRAHTPRG